MYLLALSIGFLHAFEADHLVAVSAIVTKRKKLVLALKDGAFWGLGHTSILLLVALVFLLGKVILDEKIFNYLEAAVGFMLVFLGIFRLSIWFRNDKMKHEHAADGSHKLAYGVGLLHGLAGSGAVLLSILPEIKGQINMLIYLLIFGFGSIVGMVFAAGLFSLPISNKFFTHPWLSRSLVLLSALLCIIFGYIIIKRNL